MYRSNMDDSQFDDWLSQQFERAAQDELSPQRVEAVLARITAREQWAFWGYITALLVAGGILFVTLAESSGLSWPALGWNSVGLTMATAPLFVSLLLVSTMGGFWLHIVLEDAV